LKVEAPIISKPGRKKEERDRYYTRGGKRSLPLLPSRTSRKRKRERRSRLPSRREENRRKAGPYAGPREEWKGEAGREQPKNYAKQGGRGAVSYWS